MIDLAGTWMLEVVVATITSAPVFGETRSASRSRLAVTVEADGAGWRQRQVLCGTAMEGGTKLARTVLPEAWVTMLPPRSYAVELTPDGAWRADTGVQVVGYDPALGPLPLRGDEPQVVDTDGDGEPGATVLVTVPGFGTGRVYVAQRGHSRLEGRVVAKPDGTAPERIEGRVVVIEQSQATLGASHGVFDFTPTTRPDPERSTFVMWRVEGGGCR